MFCLCEKSIVRKKSCTSLLDNFHLLYYAGMQYGYNTLFIHHTLYYRWCSHAYRRLITKKIKCLALKVVADAYNTFSILENWSLRRGGYERWLQSEVLQLYLFMYILNDGLGLSASNSLSCFSTLGNTFAGKRLR